MEIKKEIETRLINLLTKIDVEIPSNFEELLSFITEDIINSKDLLKWDDRDIGNGLKKFIELKN
jgi:hypothetical protein